MTLIKIQDKPLSWLFTGLIIFFVFFTQAAHAQPIKSDKKLDKKFSDLGIIKISGIQAPDYDLLVDMDGNKVLLSDFKGKIVFLNFWTTWCPSCVYEMPDMEKLHQKLGNKDFAIVAIDMDESKKKVARFISKHNLSFKILLDRKGDMGRVFGIRAIPTTFILNKDGGIIGKAVGARDWDGKESINLFKYLIEKY